MKIFKEIAMWVSLLVGALLGIVIAAAAAGFLFGLFVKVATLVFFFTGA